MVGVTVPGQRGQAPVGTDEPASERRGQILSDGLDRSVWHPQTDDRDPARAPASAQPPQRLLLLAAATAGQMLRGERALSAVGGLTVSHRDDADRPSSRQQLREQPTDAERLVVRMGRHDQGVPTVGRL